MTAIEILDNIQHQELSIDFLAARLASRKTIIPVVISEFPSLMFHYPILFVKDRETGEFTCSVLLGINEKANLLDAKNIADDDGLPLNIIRLPLVAAEPPPGDTVPLVAINMAAPGIGQGEYILKEKSTNFESAVSALGELYNGLKETRAYVKKLVELDLISKLHAEIRNPDQPPQVLEGLYSIDMNKIAQLAERDEASKDAFLDVASHVYAQVFSLCNMKKLAKIIC